MSVCFSVYLSVCLSVAIYFLVSDAMHVSASISAADIKNPVVLMSTQQQIEDLRVNEKALQELEATADQSDTCLRRMSYLRRRIRELKESIPSEFRFNVDRQVLLLCVHR